MNVHEELVEVLDNPYCKPEIDVRPLSREEWLSYRNNPVSGGIGGSEAAGCLPVSLSPYSSRLLVVMTKIGIVLPDDDNDDKRHGRRMEPVLRREFPDFYLEETGEEIVIATSPFLYRSRVWPWMIADVDGLGWHRKRLNLDPRDRLVPMGPPHFGLEIKAVGRRNGWGYDEIPDYYYCQVQHYMAVFGLPEFIVPVLIGKHFEYRHVPRNETFIAALVQAEKEVWEMVQKRILPAPSGISREIEVLQATNAQASNITVELPDLERTALEYRRIKVQMEQLEIEKTKREAVMMEAMGSATRAVMGSYTANWPRWEQSRFDFQDFRREHPSLFSRYQKTILTGRFEIE